MLVKLKVGRAGDGFAQDPGSVVDIADPAEAGRMYTVGQCAFEDPKDLPIALAASGTYDPLAGAPTRAAAQTDSTSTSTSAPNAEADDWDGPAINENDPVPGEPVTALDKAKAKAAKVAAAKS